LQKLGVRKFVNADGFARGLSAFDQDAAAFEAGQAMLARLKALGRRPSSFAFKKTPAGRILGPVPPDPTQGDDEPAV
jgi:predicted ABC-type ATPase